MHHTFLKGGVCNSFLYLGNYHHMYKIIHKPLHIHAYIHIGTKSFFLDSRINFMQKTYPLFLPSSFQEQDTNYL